VRGSGKGKKRAGGARKQRLIGLDMGGRRTGLVDHGESWALWKVV